MAKGFLEISATLGKFRGPFRANRASKFFYGASKFFYRGPAWMNSPENWMLSYARASE